MLLHIQGGYHLRNKITNIRKGWRHWIPCTLLVGMENGTATVEKSTAIPPKINRELPCDLAIPFLGMHLKESRDSNKLFDIPVHNCIIHNSQKEEATQISINE